MYPNVGFHENDLESLHYLHAASVLICANLRYSVLFGDQNIFLGNRKTRRPFRLIPSYSELFRPIPG